MAKAENQLVDSRFANCKSVLNYLLSDDHLFSNFLVSKKNPSLHNIKLTTPPKPMNFYLPKTTFLLCLFLLCTTCNSDDETPIPNNVTIYGPEHFNRIDDVINGQEMILDDEEGVFIVGNGTEAEISFIDPYLVKVDADFEFVWKKELFGPVASYPPLSLALTRDDEIATLFYEDQSSDFKIIIETYEKDGQDAGLLVLPVVDLELLPKSLTQLPNKDFVFVSTERQSGFLDTIPRSAFITRATNSNEVLWSKVLESEPVYDAQKIRLSADEMHLFALLELSNTFPYSTSVKIYKLDLDGNVIWEKDLPTAENISPRSSDFAELQDGNILIFNSLDPTFSAADQSLILKMLDPNGEQLWSKSYPVPRSGSSGKVIQQSDGSILLLSSTSNYGNNSLDVQLSKLDIEGTIIWQKIYRSDASDHAAQIEEYENGDLLIMGSTNYQNSSDARFDFFLIRTDGEGVPR